MLVSLQDRMLDRLGDIMTFGCLEKCMECSGGQFVYQVQRNLFTKYHLYLCIIAELSGITKRLSLEAILYFIHFKILAVLKCFRFRIRLDFLIMILGSQHDA
jgi:hypothetical protein